MVDALGVIRFWNAEAERVFGHLASTALGRTLDLIVPEDYRQAHWAGFRRAIVAGEAAAEGQPGPFPALCENGEIKPVQGRLTLLRSAQGQVIGAMVVFG